MAIDKTSVEWSLGLLHGYALHSGNELLMAASEHIIACFDDAPDEAAEIEGEIRTGRWAQDEHEALNELIAAKTPRDEIVADLQRRFGRKEDAIGKKVDEASHA